MKKTEGLFERYYPKLSSAMPLHIAESVGIAILLIATGTSVGQVAMPDSSAVAPNGYTLHGSINLGGNMTSLTGSGAMYDTLVNIQSGPRVLGSSFEMQALPTTKHTLVDSLTAFSTGWGGNPYDLATMDFSKGKIYQFSGRFRRDRQYFDYNLLGNPNIPSGQSIPIGPTDAPTGSLAWPQVKQSPFLYNTVRRMTDTNLTIFPISKVTYRLAYSQNVFQGPSLSPGGSSPYFAASIGTNTQLLEQYQRNSTDDFIGAIDWKPVPRTTLTFEEEIDHYKNGSYFTLAPSDFFVQESDGTKVAPGGWDSLSPYGLGSCNTGSMGVAPYTILSPAQTPGGLPIINPACSVAISYLRSQPTRILYPTEIFRFQSSSIRNIAMNGDVRYTEANMNLPKYYENFQGLSGAVRSITFGGNANAKRKVVAIDYGINWNATKTISVADQIVFSNVQQPGVANISTGSTLVTPPNPNETINYSGPLTPGKPATVEGNPNGTPQPGFFGQKFLTNNLMATWDGWSRATFSVTYRYRTHIIAEGIPHNAPLAPGATNDGTVTIHENGGIFNVALRPSEHWDLNGSLGLFHNDNAFTPMTPREMQRYRVHTIIRPRSWATISGAFNDVERHNNTHNTGTPSPDGPLDHVDHSRVVSVGAVMSPNAHYGFDFNYSYGDVYASTNICYLADSSPTQPGAATPSGTACPDGTVRGAKYYMFGPVKDFMDAPTQYGSVALHVSPTNRIQSNIGYTVSSVNGSRFFNDARDVNGSLVSTYQSPFVNFAWTVRKAWIVRAEYNYYGYGEGGPSGAALCSTSNPTPTSPATPVPCNSPTLAGLQTGLTISPAGETSPRNFHANNVTMGLHYEF